MVHRWNVWVLVLTFSALFIFTGCSSFFAAFESDAPSSSAGEQSADMVANPTSPSTREALRRGLAPVTPPGSPLKDLYFDYDSYDLRSDAREILKANANWLESNPSARIEIEGHCDERGTNEFNLALGAKRAQIARDYLVNLGIPADLPIISYGEEAPVCMDHTKECWQKNRRVRFVIITILPIS